MVTGALPSCFNSARVECRSCAEVGTLVKCCEVVGASKAKKVDCGGVVGGLVVLLVSVVSVPSKVTGVTFALGDLQTEGK